jgi:hypothetical protein
VEGAAWLRFEPLWAPLLLRTEKQKLRLVPYERGEVSVRFFTPTGVPTNGNSFSPDAVLACPSEVSVWD